MLEGMLGVAAGIVTLLWPGITLFVLSIMVGVWALITGAAEITGSFELSRIFPTASTTGRILLGLSGLVSIALGVAILVWPALGAITLITMVAVYALVFGVMFVALGMHLRHHPAAAAEDLGRPAAA